MVPQSPQREAFVAFAVAMVATVLVGLAARGVPLLQANLGAAVAVVFLYTAYHFAGRQDKDLADFGFGAAPIGRGLAVAGVACLVLFPLFTGVFLGFYELLCSDAAPEALRSLTPPTMCRRYDSVGGAAFPSLSWKTAEFALVQLVVAALPEELLFRGYMLSMLERAFPPKRRILGGGVGLALVISSALFAVIHLSIGFDPRRLVVFFPGLVFGWMRSATGSILAGTLFHWLSNVYIHLLERTFF